MPAEEVGPPPVHRDPVTVRWRLLLLVVVLTTAVMAVGWALATRSLSATEAKVEPASVAASRAEHEKARALDCADFADDKTRDEFISHGGPAKGCDMGYASPARSRELVTDAQAKADRADVSAEVARRDITAASGVVDQWLFGIALAAALGTAALAIAPRHSPQPSRER